MIRIKNNTNCKDVKRLLNLYSMHLKRVNKHRIECIVFEHEYMRVFGIDTILLEVRN